VHWLAEYYLKLFKSKLPSAFVKLVATIIVWPLIPKPAKELGFQKKKPFPVGKRYLPIPKLRQHWRLSGKLYPIRAGSDHDYNAVKQVGYSSVEVIEVIAILAKYLFTNYFKYATGAAIDFSAAPSKG
jgi:hypothetical protein